MTRNIIGMATNEHKTSLYFNGFKYMDFNESFLWVGDLIC